MVDELNMVIVVRKGLKMPKGKAISQGAHAAVAAILQSIFNTKLGAPDFKLCDEGFEISKPAILDEATIGWLSGEFTKICVAVNSEAELDDIYNKASEAGLSCSRIIDNGHNIADLEYFCMGERGDQYRGMCWPYNIHTKYLVDPNKKYNTIDIHYAYVGDGVSVQKSEKDITIVVPKVGAKNNVSNQLTNDIITAINAATGLTIATLDVSAV